MFGACRLRRRSAAIRTLTTRAGTVIVDTLGLLNGEVKTHLFILILLVSLWCLSAFFIYARWDAWVLEGVLGAKRFSVSNADISPSHEQEVRIDGEGRPAVINKADGRTLTTFTGHDGRATSAQFSPDGNHVVSTGQDRTARIWEALSGKQRLAVSEPAVVNFANFSPEGTAFVTANEDGKARVYSFPQGRLLSVLSGHDKGVFGSSYAPDGGRIVTASADNTARIWDAGSGKLLEVLRLRGGTFDAAQFTPDGKRVVMSFKNQTAWVWLRRHAEGVSGFWTRPEVWAFVILSFLIVRLWRRRPGPVARGRGYGGLQYE